MLITYLKGSTTFTSRSFTLKISSYPLCKIKKKFHKAKLLAPSKRNINFKTPNVLIKIHLIVRTLTLKSQCICCQHKSQSFEIKSSQLWEHSSFFYILSPFLIHQLRMCLIGTHHKPPTPTRPTPPLRPSTLQTKTLKTLTYTTLKIQKYAVRRRASKAWFNWCS